MGWWARSNYRTKTFVDEKDVSANTALALFDPLDQPPKGTRIVSDSLLWSLASTETTVAKAAYLEVWDGDPDVSGRKLSNWPHMSIGNGGASIRYTIHVDDMGFKFPVNYKPYFVVTQATVGGGLAPTYRLRLEYHYELP